LFCEFDLQVDEHELHISLLKSVIWHTQWGLVAGLDEDVALDGVMVTAEDLAREVEHSPATRVSNSFSLDLMSFSG